MKFNLTEDENRQIDEWLLLHNKSCPYYDDGSSIAPKTGAIGGSLTYQFTPTGLGVIIKVVCACGEKVDVTDYESW